MAKGKVKIKVSSGKSGNSERLSTQKVYIKKNVDAQGKPFFQTRAQLNLHIQRGTRPTKTELKRAY